MVLQNLRRLYYSMRAQTIDSYRFSYHHGQIAFDVFFFTDEVPFVLLFGVQGDTLSFEFKVEKGFQVDPNLDPAVYKRLCQILGLQFTPENPFSPSAFLIDFDNAVPRQAHLNQRAQPQDVAAYRRDVEEANRIYFWGWLDNNLRGNRVSHENLDKTRKLLGPHSWEICKRKNISSRWTDRRELAVEVTLPD